jgi:hypothetical protein
MPDAGRRVRGGRGFGDVLTGSTKLGQPMRCVIDWMNSRA